MHVTLVNIQVKTEHINDFIEACRINHEASIQEPGNRRFDVLQSPDQPGTFILYEAYSCQDDALAHKTTQHYQVWRDTVADWMASPRVGIAYNGLYPTD